MTADLDTRLQQLVRQSSRLIWVIVAVLSALLLAAVGAIVYLMVQASGQRAEIQQLAGQAQRLAAIAREQSQQIHAGLCFFDRDLAAAPLTVVPGTGRPSQLGVAIVADSHNAFLDIGCPGDVPPNPSLRHWAAIFHVPLR